MAYADNATYTADDIAPIVVDGLGALGVAIVSLITLVGIVILYVWVRKKLK